MATASKETTSTRWLRPFLVAVVAVLAAILLGTTASASAAVGAETRVGAFNVAGEVLVGPPQHESPGQRLGNSVAGPDFVVATGVAANSGSRIAANAAAGNAARDALAAAHPGSLIEQSFTTTAGVRRLDILTQGLVGIESKVGRTSLTATTRSQIAKDSLLLRNGDVNGIEWVFSRSGVTGQIGPTGPLADALSKAGIPWSLAP